MTVISGGVVYGMSVLAKVCSIHDRLLGPSGIKTETSLPHPISSYRHPLDHPSSLYLRICVDNQKYLLPHLRPPSTSTFQQTSSSLADQFAEADRLLNDLQASTNKLQETLDTDRERVTAVVEGVEEATKLVKEGEEKWREEMREVRGEVESLRELVPRVNIHPHLQDAS
jgi:hypothetical protein